MVVRKNATAIFICSDEFFKSVWKLTSDKVKQKIRGQSVLYTYKCSHSAPKRIFQLYLWNAPPELFLETRVLVVQDLPNRFDFWN